MMKMLFGCLVALVPLTSMAAEPLKYSVSWLGNSFSGASNKWVQNFFIHTQVQPDGTVNTWSHWDEGGKKFGVCKGGDVIGNTNVNPNSLETRDQLGRLLKLEVAYTDPKHQEWEFAPKGITCDGAEVGVFNPDKTVGGNQNIGWMDAMTDITPKKQGRRLSDVCGRRLQGEGVALSGEAGCGQARRVVGTGTKTKLAAEETVKKGEMIESVAERDGAYGVGGISQGAADGLQANLVEKRREGFAGVAAKLPGEGGAAHRGQPE